MSTPIRHHYVPQMLLRRFTNDDGNLYLFNKNYPEKGVFSAGPRHVFVEKHLYSTEEENGERDHSLELRYSQIEYDASKAIDKIVTSARSEKLPSLSEPEKNNFDDFTATLLFRNPSVWAKYRSDKWFEEIVKNEIEEIEEIRPLRVKELEMLSDSMQLTRLKSNIIVAAQKEDHPLTREYLYSKGLGIALIRNPKKSFIVGSDPIVKLTPPNGNLSDPSSELWLTLAHDVAVMPFSKKNDEKLISISPDNVRKINRFIAGQSDIFAGRDKALVQSLANPR